MLTQDDINWMKNNRSELIAGRTESVTLIKPTKVQDPYTNEWVESGEPARIVVQVTWEEVSAVATIKDFVIEYPTGADIRRDNVLVSFDETVDLTDIKHVERQGVLFEFLSINEKGIGMKNRTECVARRVV